MQKNRKIIIALAFLLTFGFFLPWKNAHADAGTYAYENISFYAQTNPSGYISEVISFYAFKTQAADTFPVYRFYNNKNGDHFYTASEDDRNVVLNNPGWGYVAEGVSFYAFKTQVANTLPVYRFYNTRNGDHFYTASEDDRSVILNNPQWGYVPEVVAFYAYASQIENTSPIYRFYAPTTGDHFYTASETDRDALSILPVYRFYNTRNGDHFYTVSENDRNVVLSNPGWGYVPEGVSFYAFKTQAADTFPVYRFYNNKNGDHFYTASENDRNIVLNNPSWGYVAEGIAFYTYASQVSNSLPVYRFYNSSTGDHFYTASETERSYLIMGPLGPEISVGLWYYSKDELTSGYFQISANKKYNIKDQNGNIVGTVDSGSTKVEYTSGGNFNVYSSIPDTAVENIVNFDAVDGDNSNLIFDVNRPGSSYDHYRGKIKLQYYRGVDIYNGTSNTVTQIWVINMLPLEQYAWGSGETTGTGNAEHTKVMETIYRTYGYWYIKYATKYMPYGFKIKSDSGSQVYSGYDREAQYGGIRTAAEATRGRVVSYGSDVALTPYSSWSDGRTRSYQEVWGSTDYPWCKSVSDPYGKHPTMTTQQLQDAGNHMVGLIANGSLSLATDHHWDYSGILRYYYTGVGVNVSY